MRSTARPETASLATSATAGNLEVRAALPADLDIAIALRIALLEEHASNPVYGRLRPDAAHRARRLFAMQLASPNEVTFLAHLDTDAGRVAIGILRCIETTGSPLLFPEKYGYVSSVFVRPEHRREGVLRALLAEGEAWCRSRGLSEMRLHNVSDYAAAGLAWQALGFEVVEQLRLRPLTG